MIEKMKMITLLVSEKGRDEFVTGLRKEGLVHIKHVHMPVNHEISFLEDKISKVDDMIEALKPYVSKENKDIQKLAHHREVIDCSDLLQDAFKEKSELETEIEEIKERMLWFENWGDIDPRNLSLLKDKGVFLRLYRINKSEYKEIKNNKRVNLLKKYKGQFLIVLVSMDPGEMLSFDEILPPGKTRQKMEEDIKNLTEKIGSLEALFRENAKKIASIKECRDKLVKEHEYLKVRCGMKPEGAFAYLQGFCPEKRLPELIKMVKREGAGYLFEEPADPEETPTHITNPGWIRIINPVFQFMNTLPGYKEFDISLLFLVFFSLFFAMLIGDAGYGVIFLITTFSARRKFKKASSEPFFLMYVLSVGTIVWGALTGTWFGAERIAQLPFLNDLVIHQISSFTGNNQSLMIYICFIIGLAHLTIAHALRAVRFINSLRAVGQIGWIMILGGMFFTAGTFVIEKPFPPYGGWLLIAGIVLVIFFSNPQKGMIKGMLSTLANLPLSVISSFSDIVSYLRLFAVGYASVVVAGSFNNLAIGDGINSILSGFIAAIILFLGHALNILLGFMAVIVHGVRLNMLEFSGHLDMQWTGKKYEPFRE